MTEVINPKPAFVIKSKLLTLYKNYPQQIKIFINVLTDPIIPKPETDFEPLKTFPLIMENKWEIPIYVVGDSLQEIKDKKGNKSLYVNCIINDLSMRWCLLNTDLLTILKEWCIESIEFRFVDDTIEIDRASVATPKLSYKGNESDIIDLEVDVSAINSVNSMFEESTDLIDASQPLGVIELKKLETENRKEQDEELGMISIDELLGKTRPDSKKKPLIEVIEDMTITPKTSSSTVATTTGSTSSQRKLNTELTVTRLSPEQTPDHYKLLLKFKSETDKYKLSFLTDTNEIHLTTTDPRFSAEKSTIKFPLPFDITGQDIKSFFNTKDRVLYVYIK